MDVEVNLVGLCAPFCGDCHLNHHVGKKPTTEDLLKIVAKREKCSANAVNKTLWLLRRLPNKPTEEQIRKELSWLKAKKLARRVLRRIGLCLPRRNSTSDG